jgi:hypothetical protein
LWNSLPSAEEKDDVLGAIVYVLVSCCNILRENEGFKLDLSGLRKHLRQGQNHTTPHCVAPLLGRFIGEDGERYHLLLTVSKTALGLELRRWTDLLVECPEKHGLFQGLAFVDSQGKETSLGKYEALILGLLQDHQHWEEEQGEDSEGTFVGVDIAEVYGILGSFKRGALTRAQEAGISQPGMAFIGCWRMVE